MRAYPKGARWYVIGGGYVSGMAKSHDLHTIDALFSVAWLPRGRRDAHRWLVLKPRGKNKWYLFIKHHQESPRLVSTSTEPDSLIAHAVLTG